MKNTNYKPIIILAIVLLIFYCSGLFALIPILLFNIDIKTCSDTTYNVLRLIPNVALAIVMVIIYRTYLKEQVKDFFKHFGNYTDVAIKYWVLGFIGMVISNYIIINLTPVKIASNEAGIREIISVVPFTAFISVCLFAPIAEELIFRKAFKDCFNNKWLFILISGITFGSLHVIGSINSMYDLLYIIPYSSLGIAFAIIYYKTDNICSSIFAHVLHNTLLVLINIFYAGVILL